MGMGPAALKRIEDLPMDFLIEQIAKIEDRTIAADLELLKKERQWRDEGRVNGDWYVQRAKSYLLSSLRNRSEWKRALKRRLKKDGVTRQSIRTVDERPAGRHCVLHK